MQPTNKLRFVKRIVPNLRGTSRAPYTEVRVLQQWWIQSIVQMDWGDAELGPGEWRDVPLEDEDAEQA